MAYVASLFLVVVALSYGLASYSMVEGKSIGTIAAKTTWFPQTTPFALPKIFQPKASKDFSGGGYVQDMIQFWATKYGADQQKMMKIAQCESGFDPAARNPKSSAKGVFQFIDSTWAERCRGDVLNGWDNVRCAAQLLALGEYAHWDESKSCWD